tara:strand:+ start:390 stop:1835 length:1446 start_codon:yes stop_codon:yes gene_type:complete
MSSIRQFWKHSAIYGIGSVMVRAISFFLLPLYTNSFSRSETGYIFLVFTFIAFAQIVYYHGLDSAFLQYYRQDATDKDSVGRTSIIMIIITSTIFSCLIILFADIISSYVFDLQEINWVIYSAGILFFDAISSRMMILIRIQEHALIFLIISIVNVISTLLTSYILVISYGMGIDGVLIGVLIGAIIRWLMLLPYSLSTLRKGFFSFLLVEKLLKFGFPFFPAALFYLILEMSDRYLLFWILGPESVGVYSIGYKLGSLALFIITAFNLGWQPFYIKIGNQENAGVTFGKIGTIFLHLLIVLWGFIVFWTPILMKMRWGENYLIGKEFWSSEQIVPIIFLSYIFYAGYIVLMPSIYILEKQKWSPIIRGTGAILNILLNYLFIKYWGILGAAFSTLIAYMAMFFFIFYKSNQWLKILCDWKTITKHFIITSIFILIYIMIEKNLFISLGFTFLYICIVLLLRGKAQLFLDLKYLNSSLNDV